MKRYVSIMSIALFMLLMVACANTQSNPKTLHEEPTDTNVKNEENVELLISAAASLHDVLHEVKQAYKEVAPNVTLTFNFGASGTLQQQISQGAPVDLFFSAAEDKFDILVEEEIIVREDSVGLLKNEMVLIVSKDNHRVQSFEDLEKENVDQIAIGTVESVPAGKYAKEVLKNKNVWEGIESKIVYAKDVRQVLSYVETGNVDAGIVYKTDAMMSDKVEMVAIAEPSSHTPIIYSVGIIQNSVQYDTARDFLEFLQSEEILKVFEHDGFII